MRIVFVTWVVLGLTFAANAQQDELYKPIDVAELARNLPKYWAIGILFKDTLVQAPARDSITISGKRYTKFMTQRAGDCYVSDASIDALPELNPGDSYLFAGTVLQRPGGWFGGGSKYLIAVNRITPALQNVSDLGEMLKQISMDANNPDHQVLKRMNDLFTGLQSDIAAKAQNLDVAMYEMFLQGSTNRVTVQDIVSSELNSMAQQTKLTPEDLLAQYVIALLASRYAQPEPAPSVPEEIEPVEDTQPEPVPQTESKPKEEKKKKAAAPKAEVKTETPSPKLRLRATPAEIPESPAEKIDAPLVPAPVPEPMPAEPAQPPPAPVLPEPTADHVDKMIDQVKRIEPPPAQAAAAPPEKTSPQPTPIPAEPLPYKDDANAPVPL